ncbi:hypothetical protein KEM56_004184 [Ascosphaera pollenicola]|nr:hypothetical protein KEM56_004184 [Ascosphaera pollenicola]
MPDAAYRLAVDFIEEAIECVAARVHKYGYEMLHLQNLLETSTPELADAILAARLVTQKTKKGKWKPIDLEVEHMNQRLNVNLPSPPELKGARPPYFLGEAFGLTGNKLEWLTLALNTEAFAMLGRGGWKPLLALPVGVAGYLPSYQEGCDSGKAKHSKAPMPGGHLEHHGNICADCVNDRYGVKANKAKLVMPFKTLLYRALAKKKREMELLGSDLEAMSPELNHNNLTDQKLAGAEKLPPLAFQTNIGLTR